MKMSIDVGTLIKGIKLNDDGYKAIIRTIKRSGSGEVICSKRKKQWFEKKQRKKDRGEKRLVTIGRNKKALHGRFIAYMLKKHGNDPFDYPKNVITAAHKEVNEDTEKAIAMAFESKDSQEKRIEIALRQVALDLADWAIENIESGRLGKNTKGQRSKKTRLVDVGIATKKYGVPPPYGILSGRFVEGIRSRWRLGRLKE